MKLNASLPDREAKCLASELGKDEKIRYCLASDLTLDRQFGKSYLVVTDARRIIVLDHVRPALTLSLEGITEVKVDELFGSGRLVAVTEEGEKSLIFYSKAYVPEFAVLCRVINDLVSGREPELPEEEEPAYCDRCGGPLPERAAACSLCVPRFKILVRLFGLLKPYMGRVILLLIMTFAAVAAPLGAPYITGKLIVDDVITKNNLGRLPLYIGLLLGCGVLLLVAGLVSGYLTVWLGVRVVADLRPRLHATLQRLQMSYFSRRESGEIHNRVMHDTDELQHFLIDGSSYFLSRCITFIAIAVILIYLDARLAMLVFLPVPFLIGGSRWFWKKLIPIFHKHSSRRGALHSVIGESIHGIRPIKAFAREKKRIQEFDDINEQFFGIRLHLERTWIGFSEIMGWIMSIGFAVVWFFGARRIVAGDPDLSVGVLVAFSGYIVLFYGPLKWFTAVLNWMTHAFSGAERIFAVLDSREEVYDAPDAIAIPKIEGAISFQDVHFSYERGKEVIKGISFDITPGEMVGLVGKSGAGKSTIINLICRFYDIDSGSITIDGHPIQKVKLAQLRRQLGIVSQEPFLFNASILENIKFGSLDASFEKVVRAAKAANAHDFILDKEDGYDTVVGERGAKLSAGEKQRLAIARAILYDPAILILDEATSSIDSETEVAIQKAMANLIRGRTTVAIAHRLSTLRNANRLIVVDDGRIAEIGTHEELLAEEGIYSRLAKTQTELSRLRGEVWKE